MSRILKHCPFCAGKARLIDNAYNVVGWNVSYYSAYVQCTSCGAKGREIKLTECYGPPDGTVDDAIDAWNMRIDCCSFKVSAAGLVDI